MRTSFTDRLSALADRFWLVFLVLFGFLAFIIALPHQYLYHY